MKRGSPAGKIIGGALLLALDAWSISIGHLPLKGNFSTTIDVADTPRLFWAYAISLAVIGVAAVSWGIIGSMRR